MREETVPSLEAKVTELEKELKEAKLKSRALDCYYSLDTEKTNTIGFKVMV